jgi:hypothetical protein
LLTRGEDGWRIPGTELASNKCPAVPLFTIGMIAFSGSHRDFAKALRIKLPTAVPLDLIKAGRSSARAAL